MNLILLVVFILLLAGAFPTGGYGLGHPYGTGGIGAVLLVVIILVLCRVL